MKFYFTFGSAHEHNINGKALNGNTIAVVEAEDEGKARKVFSDAVGLKWSHCYLDPEDCGKTKYGLTEVILTNEDLAIGKVARDEKMADRPRGVHWFSDGKGILGLVTKKDKVTGEMKAYIGRGEGGNQEADIKYIMDWGAKITLDRFEVIYKEMKGE